MIGMMEGKAETVSGTLGNVLIATKELSHILLQITRSHPKVWAENVLGKSSRHSGEC